MAPLLLLVVASIALVFEKSEAQRVILNEAHALVGADGAGVLESILRSAQNSSGGIVASLVGLLTLLFGASGVFGELRSALNRIWQVEPPPVSGFWTMLREHIFAFGMVLAVAFLLLMSLVLSAGLSVMGTYWSNLLPMPEAVVSFFNVAISLVAIAFLFALMFKYLPDRSMAWRDVWVGSAATAVLFTLGKYVIGLYLGKAAVGSAYGAAGSLVALVVWVYYSTIIFFTGAELTAALQKSREETLAPI